MLFRSLTEEHYLYPSPADVDAQDLPGLPSLPTSQDLFALASSDDPTLAGKESNKRGSGSSNTSSSTEESDGPITPETYAVDNADLMEVPELSESNGVGIPEAIMPDASKKPKVAGDHPLAEQLAKLAM